MKTKFVPEKIKKTPSEVLIIGPIFFLYWPGYPNGPKIEIPYRQKPLKMQAGYLDWGNNQVMKSGGEHQEKSSAQIYRADNKRQKKHNMAWNIVGDKLKKISWVKHVGDLNLRYIQY